MLQKKWFRYPVWQSETIWQCIFFCAQSAQGLLCESGTISELKLSWILLLVWVDMSWKQFREFHCSTNVLKVHWLQSTRVPQENRQTPSVALIEPHDWDTTVWGSVATWGLGRVEQKHLMCWDCCEEPASLRGGLHRGRCTMYSALQSCHTCHEIVVIYPEQPSVALQYQTGVFVSPAFRSITKYKSEVMLHRWGKWTFWLRLLHRRHEERWPLLNFIHSGKFTWSSLKGSATVPD